MSNVLNPWICLVSAQALKTGNKHPPIMHMGHQFLTLLFLNFMKKSS